MPRFSTATKFLTFYIGAMAICLAAVQISERQNPLPMLGISSGILVAVLAIKWAITSDIGFFLGNASSRLGGSVIRTVVILAVLSITVGLFLAVPALAVIWMALVGAGWIAKQANKITGAAQAHADWARRH